MVKISPDLLFSKIKEDNFSFWVVTDGVNTYGTNNSEEDSSKSISRLKNTLEEIDGDTVTVTIKDKTTQQGNPKFERQANRIKEQVFLIKLDPRKKNIGTSAKETITDSFFSNGELKNFFFENQDLKLKIQGLQRDLAELQKINAELEQELNEVEEVEENDTIAGLPKEMVQNAVMGILGLTQKQPSAQTINGIEVETSTNTSNKLKSILQRIKKVDSNYINNLEILAKFMEQKPDQYFAFLPTMKGITR
jgi:phosphorylcholine metabolism protein LicD